MSFHNNKSVQKAARDEYKHYVGTVMSSTYGPGLQVSHICEVEEASFDDEFENDINNLGYVREDSTVNGFADDIFYDYIKGSAEED